MFPNSTIARLLLGAWFFLSVGVLAFAYVQRDIHDMPIVATWLSAFLSAPLGLLVAPLVGSLTTATAQLLGLSYEPFTHLLPSWLALTAAGYAQWFYALPRFFKRFRRASPGA